MSLSYRSKVDANQKEIVEALRNVGCSCALTHRQGGGFPDLVVGYVDRETSEPKNLLMEVKTKEGRLNELEEAFHRDWKGKVVVVRDVFDALQAVGRL